MRRYVVVVALFSVPWCAALAAEPAPQLLRGDEIIIEGRTVGGRYRIPPGLRTAPIKSDPLARAFDPRLACQNVGPTGCGTELLPIIGVGTDGKVQIGAPRQ